MAHTKTLEFTYEEAKTILDALYFVLQKAPLYIQMESLQDFAVLLQKFERIIEDEFTNDG